MYESGNGVEKDETEAAKWYKRSAEQGFAIAQNNFGNMLQGGKGVKKNTRPSFGYEKPRNRILPPHRIILDGHMNTARVSRRMRQKP